MTKKFVLGASLCLFLISLNSCDSWFAPSPPELVDFQAARISDSLAARYHWKIEGSDKSPAQCFLRPAQHLEAVWIDNCHRLDKHFHTYAQAGEYEASLQVYGQGKELVDERKISVSVGAPEVKTLTVHCAVGDQPNLLGLMVAGNATAREDGAPPEQARKFDSIENGLATKKLAIRDGNLTLRLGVMFKNPGDSDAPEAGSAYGYYASLVPNRFGSEVWIMPGLVSDSGQDHGESLFHSQEQMEFARATVTESAKHLDLSPVGMADETSALSGDWMDNASFMEIYVRGYKDSDGDGTGDLRGLISRLPYLEELGITALWLMPVKESSDNDHGYAVSDYYSIEKDYGSIEDFQLLLDEAHRRGIAVIIDYLINHSSRFHPLFIEAASGADAQYRDWYIWNDARPPGWRVFGHDPWRPSRSGWYYAPFSETMPDFNLRNPQVIEFHINNLRAWLNLGVDGFRFDAVGVLTENGADAWENQQENHQILKRLVDAVQAYGKRYTVCESPQGFAEYANANSCGRAFNFTAHSAILKSVRQGRINAQFHEQLNASYVDQSPFILSNHDSFAGKRVWDQLGGDMKMYRLAAQTYLLSSRNSFTYYGEEIGISGGRGLSGDHSLRVPMSWEPDSAKAGFTDAVPFRATAANIMQNNVLQQKNDPDSLYHHYRQLYLLRKDHPVIASGRLRVESEAGADYLLLGRVNENHHAVIAINYAKEARALVVETGLGDLNFLAVYGRHSDTMSDSQGMLSLTIPPMDAVVLLGSIDAPR